ncbi:MAG: MFS transporter [Bacteroidetes bacterium]|nr:MFS transporter [Bacteroidota bacterium]
MRFILSLYVKAFSNLDRNVWILALAMFVNRTGSMVLLFTSLYLTNELHFSIGHAGIAMSFYGAGSILGSFAGGWLSDRKNYFDVMVFSLLGSGLVLPAILFTHDLVSISVIIFSYAFLADMFRPALSKGIAFYSSAENRTRSVSLIRLAINLGFSIGPVIGGFVAFYVGYKPLMIIDGITSILAGIVVIMFIPRKVVGFQKSTPQTRSESRSVYRDFDYLFFILMVALYGACFFQLFASVPQYLDKVWNYNEKEIAWVLALNGFLVVLIEMPLMALLENNKKIFRFILAGSLCVPAAFTILILGYGALPVVIVYTLVITLSEILAMPFMMNFTLSRPPKERQGEYSALYSIAFGIANICAPLIGLGIAAIYDFNTMFYILITLGIINALGFWFLKNRIEPELKTEELVDAEIPEN